MKRAVAAITATIAGLVLLLSFKTHPTTGIATSTTAASTTAVSGTTTTSAASGSSPPDSATGSSTAAARTVTGDVIQTRYGPVQVQITVRNGTITAVTATQYPSGDPRSQQINAYAIPQLDAEALQAKSASIAMISGATYTSNGYIAALQSALSKAGL
jgi:uncharacterized protein with FMN-binding domain